MYNWQLVKENKIYNFKRQKQIDIKSKDTENKQTKREFLIFLLKIEDP